MPNRLPPFPEIAPFKTGFLKVSDLHTIYWALSGNPDGIPAVVLHGGPGGGSAPIQMRYHNPAHYCMLTFDQRGCGQSTPHAELQENTTWDLVADIEALRQHLGFEKWHVFGGSWGSTLALAYAQTHPDSVLSLVLRGIFLLRESEIHWFYQEGASWVFPDAWEGFIAPIPPAQRSNLLQAYHAALTGPDRDLQMRAARAWSLWEGSTLSLLPDADRMAHFVEDHFALAFARIENHYFMNRGFFPEDGHLLRNIEKIRHIPAVAVHGRYDMCTPLKNAWDLKAAWPELDLHIIPDAGHALAEPGITDALIRATEGLGCIP